MKEAKAEAKAKEAKVKEAKEAKAEAIKAQIVHVLPPRSALNVTNFNVTNSGQVSGRQGWG